MKSCYKVVLEKNNSSAWMTGKDETFYKENEYVYAPSGKPFFIFKDLESAKQYTIKLGSGFVVYECECVGVEEEFPLNLDIVLPQGTIFAYGVKLTKKIVQEKPKVKLTEGDVVKNIDGCNFLVIRTAFTQSYNIVGLDSFTTNIYDMEKYPDTDLTSEGLNELARKSSQLEFEYVGKFNEIYKKVN